VSQNQIFHFVAGSPLAAWLSHLRKGSTAAPAQNSRAAKSEISCAGAARIRSYTN